MEDFSAAMFMSITGISRRPFAASTAAKKSDGLKGKLLGLDIDVGAAAVDDDKRCDSSICSGFDALDVFAVAAAADATEYAEALAPERGTEVKNGATTS